jgi:thymidylate synthase (FAD)
MSVKLIALSQPVIGDGDNFMSAEQLIAYCARVSNPTNQLNHGTADKLLQYLTDHHHWSPFEMAHATLEIETTRDIAQQILRHRSFSFQEFSQRYAAAPDEPVFREARLQDTKNRQNSFAFDNPDLQDWWIDIQTTVARETHQLYRAALARGIAKEVARTVLPEGLTSSWLYMAGSIRSWIHYIQLRTGNGTQQEHREIAMQCRDILTRHLPSLRRLFHDNQEA